MMNNLFSIFDSTSNSIIELNWLSSWINTLILPLSFWLFNSRINFLMKFIIMKLYYELKIILFNKFNFVNIIFFTNLMMMIFLNNFWGLFPYIFTCSSHLIFSLTFSLPLWLSLMFWGWKNNYNHLFSHMIPQGTPSILMPFMVLIETISNIIRPGTLAIRLTANMIAGHLLITLLSENTINNNLLLCSIIIIIQMILLMLEFSVSIIQSYVFTILSTLYSKETN